jgi:sulfide dehydrogenase cytochrome subunit
MIRKKIGLVAVSATLLTLSASWPVFAEDLTAAMLGDPCAACHGTDGKSPSPIPPLNGLSAVYIASAMHAFKTGTRPATVMDRIAKGYTDEEIKLIAKYFAAKQ